MESYQQRSMKKGKKYSEVISILRSVRRKSESLKWTCLSILALQKANSIYLINVCDNLFVQDDRLGG
jgi:hypothetical protein